MKAQLKFFLIFLVFSLFPITTHAEAELLPIDAVLVLDVSLSMRTADPQQTSRSAMNLFIDMLEPERDRVGIVSYAGRVEQSLPLSKIYENSPQAFINTLRYASWTDHGIGLLYALQMLENRALEDSAKRQGVVVFLTDGNLNVNPAGLRTGQDSRQDMHTAVEIAQRYNIPIHTIGLNFDGSLAVEYINFISRETMGLSFEVATADEIEQIVQAFFYEMIMLYVPEEPEEATTAPAYESIAPPQNKPTAYNYNHDHFHKAESESPSQLTRELRAIVAVGVGAVLIIAVAILMRLAKKNRRVFTGTLECTIVTGIKPEQSKSNSTRVNLIAYGRKLTLSQALQNITDPAFKSVILMPCPSAPSHMPQLLLQCKNPDVTFIKDFAQQTATKGLTISSGAELEITHGNTQVFIRYVN